MFESPEKDQPAGIPWASRKAWRAANQAVADHLGHYPVALKPSRSRAREINSCLGSIFPILNQLCAHSCPWCPEPCCLKASVWFDFKDMLFLHFNKIPIPPCQPKAELKSTCRYLGAKGCRLPRTARPWICTWYLCPTQTAKLRKDHAAEYEFLHQAFSRIKADRNLLESEYINVVA